MPALAACVFVVACGDAPEPDAKAQGTSTAAPADKLANLPPEMVAAVAAGKSASVIGVHFALKSAPIVGQTLQVDIAIVPHQPFASVRAFFEPQEGVVISGGRELEPQKTIKAEQVLSHRIVLEPRREGIFMVSAAIETEAPEGTTTRIFSIPIIVSANSPTPTPAAGSPQAAPPG